MVAFFFDHFWNEPFRFFSFFLFLGCILHILCISTFHRLSDAIEQREELSPEKKQFVLTCLHYLGEVEIVFLLWAIPLFLIFWFFYGWNSTLDYFSSIDYRDPIFIFVIMILSSTKPIVSAIERFLWRFAFFWGGSPLAWWFSILTLTPLLGSLITEAASMTIAAILLEKQFFCHKPSSLLKYVTLGLLFVNVSVGGVLTHFAAPPVLMVSRVWQWDTPFMLRTFGWKALIGIFSVNSLTALFFWRQFRKLKENVPSDQSREELSDCPPWILLVHIFFLIWIVQTGDHPPLTLGVFFLFLGFHRATPFHQNVLALQAPLLVGMFLAGILVHAKLQTWWITPLLNQFTSPSALMTLLTILTSFNDNAALTHLSSSVPDLSHSFRYAIVAGAVIGGGLTIMANAPNPIGQFYLRRHFPKERISPLYLFLSALIPTLFFFFCFSLHMVDS